MLLRTLYITLLIFFIYSQIHKNLDHGGLKTMKQYTSKEMLIQLLEGKRRIKKGLLFDMFNTVATMILLFMLVVVIQYAIIDLAINVYKHSKGII